MTLPRPNKDKRYTLEVANLWLYSARLARESGSLQRCYNYLLEIEPLVSNDKVKKDELFMAKYLKEFAKYHWALGDQKSKEDAVKCLSRGISNHFKKVQDHYKRSHLTMKSVAENRTSPPLPQDAITAYQKLSLLENQLCEEVHIYDSTKLMTKYHDILNINSKSQKAAFLLARLCEKIANQGSLKKIEKFSYMAKAVIYYHLTLKNGSKYVYEALPRLLHTWFSMGTIISYVDLQPIRQSVKEKVDCSNKKIPEENKDYEKEETYSQETVKQFKDYFERACREVDEMKLDIPTYILYTALNQMLSRIDHINIEIRHKLQRIVANVLISHPQQVSWIMFSCSLNHNAPNLAEACKNIFSIARQQSHDSSFFTLMEEFVKLLKKAAFYGCKKEQKLKSVTWKDMKVDMESLLDRNNRGKIVIPNKKFMQVSLPIDHFHEDNYDAFANSATIVGFKDELQVFASLTRHKRLDIKGSDGKTYAFLAKPKDDSRVDARAMEYLELVN